MKIFVDTGDIEEIKKTKDYGILDGVTTNPSLMKKAVEKLKAEGKNTDVEEYIKKILEVCKGVPVSLEVIGNTYNNMVREGRLIFKKFNGVSGNVVVKVPVDPTFDGKENHFDGLKAVKALSDEGIPVNCTLIFTPEQALLAAKAGAKYVSPFAGRIDDLLRKKAGMEPDKTGYYPMNGKEGFDDNGIVSGVDLVAECVEVLESYGFECEVIAASIRNVRQTRECAMVESHIATIPFKTIQDMVKHFKTEEGMKSFTDDIVPEYRKVLED